jgi:hypothetical protein
MERIWAFVAAAFLVAAIPLTDEIGFALATALLVWHVLRVRGRQKAQTAASGTGT